MLQRLRSDYPRMAAIIVADSLYSKQPFVEKLIAGRFSFLLVAKPGDHKSLFQDVDGLRRGNLLDRHHTVHRGERREYEWVTGVPLNGSPDAPLINFIQFRIVEDSGKVNYRNAWVTDLVPTTDNIVQLVRAARARWKIENEGFNTLYRASEYLLELPQQRAPLLGLRGVLGSPHSPQTAHAPKLEPQALALRQVHRPALVLVHFHLQALQFLPQSLVYRCQQPVMPLTSTRITRSSAQRTYSTYVYRPSRVTAFARASGPPRSGTRCSAPSLLE